MGSAIVALRSYSARRDDEWREDFGGKQDAGVIPAMISTKPDAEDSEESDGEIGHANLVFVGPCQPGYGGGGFDGTKDVGVGGEQDHEPYVEQEQVKQISVGDGGFAAAVAAG